jgi:hypothetical protein
MRSFTRKVSTVIVLIGALTIANVGSAWAGVYAGDGAVSHVGQGRRGGSTSVDEDKLDAIAYIEGAPAEKVCQTRSGSAVTEELGPPIPQTWVEDYWQPIIGSKPPASEHIYVTHTKYIFQEMKMSCGSGVPWTATRCTPVEIACPPPKQKPDAYAIGQRMKRTVYWGEVHPRFTPDWRTARKYPFVVAQLPMFFWFPESDWQDKVSESRACNGDQCVVARVEARTVASVFDAGNGDEVSCDNRGDEVSTEAEFNAAKAANRCTYTYQHSSTTEPGNVFHATAWIEYEIHILNARGIMVPDGGTNWGVDADVSVPVGEVEGVTAK